MKIVSIRVHVLQSPLAQPFAFSQGWVHRRSATLVEVTTDSGVTGWGEAFAQGLEPPQIAAAVIEHALGPLVIGEDALATEVLWHRMYHHSRDYGRKGSVIAAISAVDMALWDIAGKHYGVPVYQLLGGAFRNRVQPYATGFYRISGQGADDVEVIQAIAAALQGRGVTLMVDTNHGYGRAEALRLGRVLDELDLRWYEEPVVPEDIEGYCELRAKLRTPIAGGENEHTLHGFRELLGRHAVDIVQPDLGSCGGITAARHITVLAQAHGIEVNPHVWGSAVAQAASLQVIAALPVTHHSIFARDPVLEYDRSSHPFRRDLVAQPMEMQEGFVEVPDGPGLGIEVRRDTLARFKVN